ncbi:MAG: LamG domain-containing protein [Lewinellaceae bacterium]|nr:LamG domain-containing protein [Lewinellaceae bacterium]
MASKKFINLLQSHEPLMDAGDYVITVQQTLKTPSKTEVFPATVRKFSVFGERFVLEPDSVHSVYPPAGSPGEHSNTFPHIILNRSTLPWERSVDGGRSGIWLALLLFDESEAPENKIVTLGEFKTSLNFRTKPANPAPNDNGPFHELGDGPDDQPVTVIDVKRALLEKIMPTRADLNFTAHSRRESANAPQKKANGSREKVDVLGPERAVLIGNRLPKTNAQSTVHLVSLENRFSDGGEFNYGTAGPGDPIRLISLKSWSFTNIDQKFNLYGMLEHLNRVPSLPAKPYLNDQVLDLNLAAQPVANRSLYGFRVDTTGTRLETDQSRFFDGNAFLSVQVPDSGVDADNNPQLDPFPDPVVFSIALEILVSGPREEAGSRAIMGREEHGKFKPGLWYVPAEQGIEYLVSGEDGVQFGGRIPGILPDNVFTRIVWVKQNSTFHFYQNGKLVHSAPAPGRMYTKDSPYLIGKVVDKKPQFSGRLKNVQVFRRVLSETEIRDIFTPAAANNLPVLTERLGEGMLALPHHSRKGKKSVSWYRGPLSARTADPGFTLPAVAADELLLLDKKSGMFDVSYAAAWQLGRLMALEDRNFSLLLFNLKRRMSMAGKQTAQQARPHLNLGSTAGSGELGELKTKVQDWLLRRHVLEQVPFHYLLPEEDMLPAESIRFFNIDPTWVRCLKDGACSIGRTTSADLDLDKLEDLAAAPVPAQSGFLLRSELVAGYPGLQILAYGQRFGDADNPDEDKALPVTRMERLSDSVLLCIFNGDVHTVDFFQKPDVLHFGLDSDGANFSKQLRKATGANLPDQVDSFHLSAGHWHDQPMRVLNFATIATAAGAGASLQQALRQVLSPAEFA